MGKVTYRSARQGETLLGGGIGILIPFRPHVSPPPNQRETVDIEDDEDEESSSKDRGWYTDVGEIESTIQDYVDQQEEELGRPLTKKEHDAIVQSFTPELQDDYEEE